MRPLAPIGILAAAVVFGLPAAQQDERCQLEAQALTSVGHFVRTAEGDVRWDVGGGVEATCGTKWLRADSASYYEARGELYLFGNVEYRDEGRRLEAERATYYEDERWVRSEGNVRFTDADGRSTLTGPVLHYYPRTEERSVERIFAPDRPHLTFYADTSSGPDAAPFDVDADRLHIYGDSVVAGAGRVVAVRGELTANADSMDLDLGRDELWLLGEPLVRADDMVLEGDSIRILLEEGEVREIEAWPDGSARGRELKLSAPALHLYVESGEIGRVVASAGDPDRTGAVDSAGRPAWARSESRDYVLTADSIDIRRPGGRLEQVIAVGRARARTVQAVVPGDSVLGSDWLEGDTVIGYFTQPDTAAAGGEAELTRLIAAGNARALYHLREEGEGGQKAGTDHPAVNYVIGSVIILRLEGGNVREAQVIGPGTGLYLEPLAQPPAGDTSMAAPDSLAGAARDTTPEPPAEVGSG
jgi:lipopolysaccharide export system protein LptA